MAKSKGALAYIDIFVDDFLGITQGNNARREEPFGARPPSWAHLHDKSRHRGWFLLRGSGPKGFTFSMGMPPPGPDGKTLVAFPLFLPMGWVESPPQLCAVTESVADPANTIFEGENSATAHLASTRPGIIIDRTWS